MASLEEKKKRRVTISIVLVMLIVLLGGFVYYYQFNASGNNIIVRLEENATEVIIPEIKEQEDFIEPMYKVDIKGEVNHPGVYEVISTSRIIDVITLAGGLTKNANTKVNNLSKKVIDEMVIIIYSNEEVSDFNKVIETEKKEQEECVCKDSTIVNDSCINNEIVDVNIDKKISINTADKELLMSLPSIGESKANSIIEYRKENGDFIVIEDIMNVSGIGETLFAKIKDYITI